jgi:hypothetical protein
MDRRAFVKIVPATAVALKNRPTINRARVGPVALAQLLQEMLAETRKGV